MTLWSNKTTKTPHVSIVFLAISKLRRCWGPRPPQKFRKSHWCVPFTATFSKRRKIGALWSERCDVLNCQNISWLFLTKFSQVTLLPKWFCEAPPPGHWILSQPTPWTPDPQPTHSLHQRSIRTFQCMLSTSVRTLQRSPAAERSSVPGVSLRSEREAWTLKVSEVLDSFYFFELIST